MNRTDFDDEEIRRFLEVKERLERLLQRCNLPAKDRAWCTDALALVNDMADEFMPQGRGQLNRH